jgi:hypothetical protein
MKDANTLLIGRPQTPAIALANAGSDNRRRDKATEAAVNRGLAATLLGDIQLGANIMSEQGVPVDVMTRVIEIPHHRRTTDWKR